MHPLGPMQGSGLASWVPQGTSHRWLAAHCFETMSAGCQGPRGGTPALVVLVGGLPWAWPRSEWRSGAAEPYQFSFLAFSDSD